MSDKKKEETKKPRNSQKISDEDAAKVKGGMMPRQGSDTCKETADTGMMGCSG